MAGSRPGTSRALAVTPMEQANRSVSPYDTQPYGTQPFNTVHPERNGYMHAGGGDVDGDEVPMNKQRQKKKGIFGNFGFCCGRSNRGGGADDPTNGQMMTYAGMDRGQYVQETRYRFVGQGAGGTHKLHGGDGDFDDEPSMPWCLCCCMLMMLILVGLLVCWLLLPEGSFNYVPKVIVDNPAQTVGRANEFVDITMIVKQVDWNLLSADSGMKKHFITEVNQAIVVEAGHGVRTKDVSVVISPGSVVVNAKLDPPAEVSAGQIRATLASSGTFASAVTNSLKMIPNFGTVCTDYDSLEIDGFNAYVGEHSSDEAKAGPTGGNDASADDAASSTNAPNSSEGSSTNAPTSSEGNVEDLDKLINDFGMSLRTVFSDDVEAFTGLDADGNGFIGRHELADGSERLHLPLDNPAGDYFKALDTDLNLRITSPEMQSCFNKTAPPPTTAPAAAAAQNNTNETRDDAAASGDNATRTINVSYSVAPPSNRSDAVAESVATIATNTTTEPPTADIDNGTSAGTAPEPIEMDMTVQGVDYEGLMAHPEVRASFEASMKKEVAAGAHVPVEAVDLEISAGSPIVPRRMSAAATEHDDSTGSAASVIVKALVHPTPGEDSNSLLPRLRAAEKEVGKRAAESVSKLPDIALVSKGTIGVAVLSIKEAPTPAPHPGGDAKPGSSEPLAAADSKPANATTQEAPTPAPTPGGDAKPGSSKPLAAADSKPANATTQANCTCEHGQGLPPDSCPESGPNSCVSCDAGYHLNNHAECEADTTAEADAEAQAEFRRVVGAAFPDWKEDDISKALDSDSNGQVSEAELANGIASLNLSLQRPAKDYIAAIDGISDVSYHDRVMDYSEIDMAMQEPIEMDMIVQGIDYAGLMADPELRAPFEAPIKGVLSDVAQVPFDSVDLELSAGSRDDSTTLDFPLTPRRLSTAASELKSHDDSTSSVGSVIVKAVVHPTPYNSDVMPRLRDAKKEVGERIAESLSNTPGLPVVSKESKGSIGVDVLSVKEVKDVKDDKGTKNPLVNGNNSTSNSNSTKDPAAFGKDQAAQEAARKAVAKLAGVPEDQIAMDLPKDLCVQEHFRYEPINMHGQDRTLEPSILACQQRCRDVPKCRHFSYWTDYGCHLQDASSELVEEAESTSGSRSCEDQKVPVIVFDVQDPDAFDDPGSQEIARQKVAKLLGVPVDKVIIGVAMEPPTPAPKKAPASTETETTTPTTTATTTETLSLTIAETTTNTATETLTIMETTTNTATETLTTTETTTNTATETLTTTETTTNTATETLTTTETTTNTATETLTTTETITKTTTGGWGSMWSGLKLGHAGEPSSSGESSSGDPLADAANPGLDPRVPHVRPSAAEGQQQQQQQSPQDVASQMKRLLSEELVRQGDGTQATDQVQ